MPAAAAMQVAVPQGRRVPAVARWRQRVAARLARFDFAPDLAEEIGTPRWYRGIALMLGLAIIAFAFWPALAPVDAAPSMRIDSAARSEFRSQIIQPLALGSDTDRHMVPGAAVVPLAFAPERPKIDLVATLGEGDSFGRMLQRAGVGAGDAARVSELVAATMPLGEIAPGTRFAMTLGSRSAPGQPRSLDKLDFRARFDLALAVSRQGSGFALGRRPIAVDTTPLRIRGVVTNGLFRSVSAAGAPMKAIQQYLETLDAHVSIDEVQPGDMFDLVVGYKRSASGESEVGDLLYAGLEHDGHPRAQLLRWGGDGQFFEASGMSQPRAASGPIMPVNGARITSGYGMRYHPILGYTRMHAGIDLAVPWGSPIYAVADGYVTYAGVHGGHGNFVRLEHGGGLGTGYAHMSRIAVSLGERVHSGQVIGYVGSTGLSTGPHLHYEVYRGGQTVDPMSMHFAMSSSVDSKDLAAFKARLAQMLLVKPGAALGSIAPKQAFNDAPAPITALAAR